MEMGRNWQETAGKENLLQLVMIYGYTVVKDTLTVTCENV